MKRICGQSSVLNTLTIELRSYFWLPAQSMTNRLRCKLVNVVSRFRPCCRETTPHYQPPRG
jgi:hypothetical protein